ncbi:hypothetical protein CPB84DRAFT_1859178 [Gymnopilus junonius]|uniref:Uncharacterized protein n=1 Tax=Gymnopilus junonius TaxID=109634 RepID=A0A9P5TFF2_GYMJU|nr:hypothetical protein CPB84DRAFT_1859178 [Gymnopilus junonius]
MHQVHEEQARILSGALSHATELEIAVGCLTLNSPTDSTSKQSCANSLLTPAPTPTLAPPAPTAALATALLAPPAPPPALAPALTPSPAPALTDGLTPGLTPDVTTGPLTDILAPLQTANLSSPQSSFSPPSPIAPETYGFAPPHFHPGFEMLELVLRVMSLNP